MTAVQSFCGLCLLLALGKIFRVKIKLLQKLYLPSSVVGGVLGLVILQVFGRYISPAWTAGWTKLPSLLINVVFAALFLGVAIPPLRTVWRRAAPQFAYGQIVAWGQYVVGIGVVLLLLKPIFKVRDLFGVLVPVGLEGGHGTAAGLAPTFTDTLGWPEGVDYGLAAATMGIVSAIVVGIALVNWAARSGLLVRERPLGQLSEEARRPAGRRSWRIRSIRWPCTCPSWDWPSWSVSGSSRLSSSSSRAYRGGANTRSCGVFRSFPCA